MDFGTAIYEFMSPTLLSKQPPQPRQKDPKKDSDDWQSIWTHLESRMLALDNWRYSWWAFWSVLAAFFIPFRYIFLVTANRMWRGHNVNNQIINSHGVLAVRTCAAGMWTGLCSPSRPWFKIGIDPSISAEIDTDGKNALKERENWVYSVFAGSNFYDIMAGAFRDEAVFAQAPILIMEDFDDVARFYSPAAGEYYLGLGARLACNTFYRKFTLTVLQIVDMFTLDKCPDQVQRLWRDGQYDVEFVVAHAIEPNFAVNKRGRQKGKVEVVPQKFTWREVYWLKGIKTTDALSRRGFMGSVAPFANFKWASVSNDAYGRSPCMDAICDNKQIQIMDLRTAEFIEKGVRPPMGADPELKNEPLSTMPGMTTYMTTGGGTVKKFWPLFEVSAQWVKVLMDNVSKIEARIDHCLYVDLFMAISRMEGVQPRNELELTKRDLERLQELGPVITLAEKEFDVIIRRVLEIGERRRILKPLPPSLANIPLKISYISILRLAQRSAESVAMKDCFTTGGELSSAAKAAGVPDPLRVLNLDKAYRKYCELNNLEPDLMYTDNEVKQHDAIRQQEMAKAQAPQNAMAAVTAAKTLSDTQLPGGNTGLGALMGQAGGGTLQ